MSTFESYIVKQKKIESFQMKSTLQLIVEFGFKSTVAWPPFAHHRGTLTKIYLKTMLESSSLDDGPMRKSVPISGNQNSPKRLLLARK